MRLEFNASTLGEVSTKLSELWRQANGEVMQEYAAKAAPGKETYKKEKKEYDALTKNKEKKRLREGNGDETPQKRKEDSDDFVDTTERLARKRLQGPDAEEQI